MVFSSVLGYCIVVKTEIIINKNELQIKTFFIKYICLQPTELFNHLKKNYEKNINHPFAVFGFCCLQG